MMDPTRFDAFYTDARQRLLHQTYALTGDQRAAQLAVRDAFIGAWHHWGKVSRHADPEGWVRPMAWSHAQRRHGARIWHRDKAADAERSATLEALSKLPVTQRKMLLLAHLTTGSMDELAREVGLPLVDAERELQSATSAFSTHRELDSTATRGALEALADPLADTRWPRATIIRRAGTTRRRTATVLGVAGAVGALVASGVAVNAADGVRPQLTHRKIAASSAPTTAPPPVPPPADLSPEHLLAADQLTRVAPTLEWAVADTSENTQGDGLVMPCQTARFANPDSSGFLVRTFRAQPGPDATTKRGAVTASAVQATELSGNQRSAKATFGTTSGWFAGCTDGQTHLARTEQVSGVGDEATLFVLSSWAKPASSLIVGVARTGRVTTTTVARTSDPTPDLRTGVTLLAAAVNALCGAPATGHCAGPATMKEIPPLPTGSVPGMISAVDLPAVTQLDEMWVGTEPRKALTNAAATQCDSAVFASPPMGVALTRTFLFPRADLPDIFGLTETVGTLPQKQAQAFVADVRRKLGTCEDKNLGTKVSRLVEETTPDADLSVWRLTVEISDQQTVTYLMGIARTGTSVGQIGFVPAAGVTITPDDFIRLVRRAQDRLVEMPPPTKPAT